MKIPIRNRVRFAIYSAFFSAPLVLALLPYAVEGSVWAILGLIGGTGALAAAFVTGSAYHGDLRTLSGLAARLANDRPVEGVSAVTLTGRHAVEMVHRLHMKNSESVTAIQEQLRVNDAIIEALHSPLFLVEADRLVVRANAAARTLFGDRLTGRDLAASLRQPDVLEAVDAVLGGGASRSVEYSLPVPVERVFEASVKPFLPAASEKAGEGGRMVVLTLHDITAIRRSEQMRADFIANASHELRTPLSSLIGFIETLRGPARDDPEAGARFLSIMHDQATRMNRLVQDLMSLSRIELDEHMLPGSRVDLLSSVEAVLASLELKAAARGIRLVLVAPPVVPAVIGDEDQLTQVFQNLISNAVKYTREKTEVTVTIAIADGRAVGLASAAALAGAKRSRANGRSVSVAVTDRGEGIPRVHLPRLTERFYRVDAARSRALGGTGLGLAIVKHIMNRHRGRLTIESEVGVGSTFTVYLPVAADDERV